MDTVMTELGRGLELARAGERARARETLTTLWDTVGEHGDALHRCSIAHHLADLQDDVHDELRWDERALAAVADLDDARARAHDASLRVRAFLPSLHLNLADGYLRAGQAGRARQHADATEAHLSELPDDDYGTMIRSALARIRSSLG
ncbi:hypothetical protein [Catenuloplanes atrovinosus]|uniref:Tetratricopeptide repeat protein n=1 Tax=Catenuloplanes atrovinosus TaxID=137266 RepID=A0AAE3YQ37_9ACTN|nr:hypothetical protein [Catenuloplanes atrovinosus]MDR7276550.1 hypothetical protein [Catenuloplanes atrovinosus]